MKGESIMDMNMLRLRAESMARRRTHTPPSALKQHSADEVLHELQVHQIELEMQNEELRNAQSALSASLNKYTQLFDASPVAYCTMDKAGIILDCNANMSQLLQTGRERLLRYPLGSFVHQQDLLRYTQMLREHQDSEQQLRLMLSKDRHIHTMLYARPLSAPTDGNPAWLVAITDISERHKLYQEVTIQGKALDATLEGVMITNDQSVITYVNHTFTKTTGYRHDEVIGKTPQLLSSGRHGNEFYRALWRELNNNGKWQGEIWNRRANGEIYPVWLNISTIYDEWQRPRHYVGVFSDISREEGVRRRLQQLAYYDGVTQLPNRHLFFDRLKQQLVQSHRTGHPFALLGMDLDRFKLINDTMGHSTGDLLLAKVGARLSRVLRENDTVARVGGDEFMAILPMSDTDNGAQMVAKKILTSMAEPFDLDGRMYHISISIGISSYPDDGQDQETLIKHADIAMYKAKESGRNAFQKYHPSLNVKLSARLDLENDLHKALHNDQLSLVYQTQYDLHTGQATTIEALLRWDHPAKGSIPAADFIALAEESGLIIDVGYWVLRTATRQFMVWRQAGIAIERLAINLSPHQFLQSNLVERIADILTESGMPPEALTIEITENAAMPNFQYSVTTLEALRRMHIAVCIDDFGSGFSSLSHLRRLPIDGIKIDRQFIAKLPHDEDDTAITQAIIAMAQQLKLKISAEGVETAAQLKHLQSLGCHAAQGDWLSKPLPAQHIGQQGLPPLGARVQ